MTINKVLILARKYANCDSSRLCLADAIKLNSNGHLIAAKQRALKSLSHSIGIFHKDYVRASK